MSTPYKPLNYLRFSRGGVSVMRNIVSFQVLGRGVAFRLCEGWRFGYADTRIPEKYPSHPPVFIRYFREWRFSYARFPVFLGSY